MEDTLHPDTRTRGNAANCVYYINNYFPTSVLGYMLLGRVTMYTIRYINSDS